MMLFLWVVVFALPVAVMVAAILWPEGVPPDRPVEEIRRRVEAEESCHPVGDF
ncbi:hypothetical protein [Nocardia sp. NPDC058497]|uniref:hypothetical protein n=1 Tax=Nocardia sp. NPDC058497 TaxID=3346529 RepID=UPI003649B67E